MAVGEIYKGEEFIFLVEIETDSGSQIVRPFDQTGGGISSTADELEIDTKDRSGSDYGKVTQTISLEGNITEGDPFPKAILKAQREKKFVKIFEVNTRDLTAEYGLYMISSFDKEYSNGDFSTYSLSGTLFGEICETTLNLIPDGAPAPEGMVCEPETVIPGGEDSGGGETGE